MRLKPLGFLRSVRTAVAVPVAVVVVGVSLVAATLIADGDASGQPAPSDAPAADATADVDKLPDVDESVPPPESGDYLVRSWGVRKCLGASGASDGIVMEAVLDSCSHRYSTIRLDVATDPPTARMSPRGLSAGGDYGPCLVPDGTADGRRIRDGSCRRPQAAGFRFDAAADTLDTPQVFRIRHAASHFCLTVSGHGIVQRECRQHDPMQQFVMEPRD